LLTTATNFTAMEPVKYISLSSEDDAAELLTRTMSTTSSRQKRAITKNVIFSIFGSTFILLLVAWIIYPLAQERRDRQKYQWVPCGETASSARAAGCLYEPMQRSWIPRACYFNEPSEEYNPYGDRDWYDDVNMTIPANTDLLRSGDQVLAFTKYFHDEHCLYGWRKLAIAVEKKLDMIDSKSYNLHHTSHCARTIADMLVWSYDHKYDWVFDRDYTKSPLMFQTCVPLKWR